METGEAPLTLVNLSPNPSPQLDYALDDQVRALLIRAGGLLVHRDCHQISQGLSPQSREPERLLGRLGASLTVSGGFRGADRGGRVGLLEQSSCRGLSVAGLHAAGVG